MNETAEQKASKDKSFTLVAIGIGIAMAVFGLIFTIYWVNLDE